MTSGSEYQPSADEGTSDKSSVIQEQMHSSSDRRIYDKLSACLFFGKFVIKMSVHLLRVHANQDEIKMIENVQKGSHERKLHIGKLCLKGNFMKVLRSGTIYNFIVLNKL